MSLLLTVYKSPAWKRLARGSGLPLIADAPLTMVEGSALLQAVQPLSALPNLLLQLTTGQSLWLAVVQAEHFLANAIENGGALIEAATQWEQQTDALLTLHRQQRRQLQLFNLQQALAHPTAFRNGLSPIVTISDYEPQPVSSSLALLAACQYLAQRPELQALNTRLQASVLPLCDSEVLTLDIDQILQHCHLSAAQLSATSDERDLILQQLHHVQEQLEHDHQLSATQLTAISDERDQLQRQLSNMQQQLDQAIAERQQLLQVQQQGGADLKATSDERDLILQQLHHVQEQLEHDHQLSATQLTAISDERDQLQRQLSNMQQQLDQAIAERQQLLQVQQQGEANLKAISDERNLILQQLQCVQEQLEREGQASAAQLAAHSDERDQLQRQLAGAQQKLEQSSAERKKLVQAQQQSESNWKATSEERDLILSQLQQVQEQLEHYYITLQTEQRNNEQSLLALQTEHKHALLAHDKQQARDIAKLESELRKTKARAASAEHAGGLLQQELVELRGSTLWRATGPARVLGRLIRKTDKLREKSLRDVSLLLSSEYFDVAWYLYTYPDVAESNLNPAEHYLLYGAAEGRLPGPLFDGNWYLQQYPDVAEAGTNPLLHFIMFGQQEGRSSSPKLLTNDSPGAED